MHSLSDHIAVLPCFSKIKNGQIVAQMKNQLKQNLDEIDELLNQKQYNWENLIEPLEFIDDRLSKSWSPVRHLNSVKSSDDLRKAYNQCLPLLSDYSTEISQNTALFHAYQQISESIQFKQLDKAQQKTINDSLRQFHLGGVNLQGKQKKQFQQIQQTLSTLKSSYENNLLDSTQSWEKKISDKSILKGLPDYALAMAEQLAEQKSLPGYRITLEMPCYLAVITYADNRELRKEVYEAFSTRASNQGVTKVCWNNADIMVNIVVKRLEKAKLLGFDNYAELSVETKMASSAHQVLEFLNDLVERSLPAAKKEIEQLKQFASEQGLEGDLQSWDVAYYSEKLKQQTFQFSEQDLKPYFSDDRVISGLFKIVNRLYGINIDQIKTGIDLWNENVRFYQIKDETGEVIGQFYLDLYARENKRGGAWMDECINRYQIAGKTQLPVAYLTCNLTPPIGEEPALFTHDEVITLFHEFGHGLHHMLTRIAVPEVAGINGVEWDAVELPSQFMENFCWEKEALNLFAKHYQTDQPIPDKLFDKINRAKNFQSAMQMVRQLEFSLFDIKLHQSLNIENEKDIQQILDQVRDQVAVMIPPANNRFQNGFAHIFAGGYAAGYYSYKWAEVLSADAFSAFEQEGIFNAETGKRFLQCILQQGGSRPAMESFKCFRGREPKIDALLKHNEIC